MFICAVKVSTTRLRIEAGKSLALDSSPVTFRMWHCCTKHSRSKTTQTARGKTTYGTQTNPFHKSLDSSLPFLFNNFHFSCARNNKMQTSLMRGEVFFGSRDYLSRNHNSFFHSNCRVCRVKQHVTLHSHHSMRVLIIQLLNAAG